MVLFGYRTADIDTKYCIGEFGERRRIRIFLAPVEGSSCHSLRIDVGKSIAKILLPLTNPESRLSGVVTSLSELLNSPAEIRTSPGWFTRLACFLMGRRIVSTSQEVMCIDNSLSQTSLRYGQGCRFIHLSGWSKERIVFESFSRSNKGTSSQFLSLTKSETQEMLRILKEKT